jgi:hypothetical protein
MQQVGIKYYICNIVAQQMYDIKFVVFDIQRTVHHALIPQIYFCNRTLHVSDSFSVHHQESSTVHTATGICNTGYADCLLAGSGWNHPDHATK